MMKKVCDRCGKEVVVVDTVQSPYPRVSVLITDRPFDTRHFDFCEECEKELAEIVTKFVNG